MTICVPVSVATEPVAPPPLICTLGDPALALNEYNAALERDPNRAIALYGRGLAKIRTGDIKGGEGDQAAARTLDPEVKQQFASYGLN